MKTYEELQEDAKMRLAERIIELEYEYEKIDEKRRLLKNED